MRVVPRSHQSYPKVAQKCNFFKGSRGKEINHGKYLTDPIINLPHFLAETEEER